MFGCALTSALLAMARCSSSKAVATSSSDAVCELASVLLAAWHSGARAATLGGALGDATVAISDTASVSKRCSGWATAATLRSELSCECRLALLVLQRDNATAAAAESGAKSSAFALALHATAESGSLAATLSSAFDCTLALTSHSKQRGSWAAAATLGGEIGGVFASAMPSKQRDSWTATATLVSGETDCALTLALLSKHSSRLAPAATLSSDIGGTLT